MELKASRWKRTLLRAQLRRSCSDFLLLELAQDREHLVQVRLFAEMIYLAKNDRPFLVDDEDRPFGYTWNGRTQPQDTVALGDLTMGKEVAAKREAQFTGFLFLKGYMAVGGVYAHAHDLGIQFGELCYASIGRPKLRRSNRRPVGHVESKHDMLLPAIVF